jgi:hypothetical protein
MVLLDLRDLALSGFYPAAWWDRTIDGSLKRVFAESANCGVDEAVCCWYPNRATGGSALPAH